MSADHGSCSLSAWHMDPTIHEGGGHMREPLIVGHVSDTHAPHQTSSMSIMLLMIWGHGKATHPPSPSLQSWAHGKVTQPPSPSLQSWAHGKATPPLPPTPQAWGHGKATPPPPPSLHSWAHGKATPPLPPTPQAWGQGKATHPPTPLHHPSHQQWGGAMSMPHGGVPKGWYEAQPHAIYIYIYIYVHLGHSPMNGAMAVPHTHYPHPTTKPKRVYTCSCPLSQEASCSSTVPPQS